MRRLVLAFAIGVTMAGSAANAADAEFIEAPMGATASGSGAYVAARIAGAFTQDTDFDLTVVPTNIVNDYKSVGFGGALAIGYAFDFGLGAVRGELETGLMSQEIESHTLAAIATTLSDPLAFGTTEIVYGMVNAAVDFDAGMGFKPFVAGGIGLAEVNFKNHGVTLAAPVGVLGPGNVTAMNDRDTGLAWHVGGGVGYEIDQNITLEASYRYFGVNEVELTAVDGTVSSVPIRQHQAMLGVRYGF